MPQFDAPGFLDDLDSVGKARWSELVSRWFDRARLGDPNSNDGPRGQFFNPLTSPAAQDAQIAVISWNAFPRQVSSNSLSDQQRWRRADSSRNLQDEYCEWSVARDPVSRKIVRVTFTCEAPEYWDELAKIDPQKVLSLYRELVSPSIQMSDLFVKGVYDKHNQFNNSTSGSLMHLIQVANTLSAEIELAAAATIRRRRNDQDITDAQTLILCSEYGEAGRNSDPHIGEQVNVLARQRADITLNNPVGLYLHQFNPVGWTTPDQEDPRTYWKFVRGTEGYFVRATYEVPPGRGYVVGDIKIAGRAIEFGAQITDFVTIKLEGLATRIGQSATVPFAGCRGEAGAPPSVELAAAPAAAAPSRRNVVHVSQPVPADQGISALPPEMLGALDGTGEDAAPPVLLPYPKLPDADFAPRQVSGRIMAYASPDSTYAVTKKLVDSAHRSLVIGIYDFSASYMKEHLKRAMRRGVTVSLMLDTNDADDENIFPELSALGAICVKAPSSSAGNPIAYFGNVHEKIVVVDDELVMIQSGNWSENSIPYNEGDGVVVGAFEPGNRDMGLAVQSRELASLFTNLVARDMRLALGQPPDALPPDIALAPTPASDTFFEAAPPATPTRLFSSITVMPTSPVSITPVVTPENFYQVVRPFLRSAKHTIRIEQQYIRGGQEAVEALLREMADARAEHPELDIRVIVSPKYLYGEQKQKFIKAMDDYGLAYDTNYRYLSSRYFVHCHNKLIVVDDERVLLGSQNWSTTGLLSNREASLLIEHAAIAAYFAQVFDADWDLSEPGATPHDAVDSADFGPRAASEFASGGVVISNMADYRNV